MERIEHSTSLIDLAGGSENMLNKMKQAYNDGKFQWALELADACIDTNNCVSNAKVKCLELGIHIPRFSREIMHCLPQRVQYVFVWLQNLIISTLKNH